MKLCLERGMYLAKEATRICNRPQLITGPRRAAKIGFLYCYPTRSWRFELCPVKREDKSVICF